MEWENLRSYQIDAINFIARKRGRCLISLCPGAGKSYVALFLRKKYPKLKKVLIVCPSSIKLQWKTEVGKIFPEDSAIVLTGSSPDNPNLADKDFVIINYDILNRDKKNSWADYLKNQGFDLIVFDESHKLKNREAARSKGAAALALNCKHVVLLTGTPITSNVLDLWHQFYLIDPMNFRSFNTFMWKFCPLKKINVNKGNRNIEIEVPGKTRNIVELNQLIGHYFFQKSEKEVYKELPEMSKIIIPVDLSNYNDYEKAENKFRKSTGNMLEASNNLQATRMVIGQGKVQPTLEWLKDFFETSSDEKLVVFGYHRAVMEQLHTSFGANKSVLYYGGMTDKAKEEAKQKFIHDKNIKVFFANIKSAGEGLDGLNTVCNKVVFIEYSYVPSDNTQAMARVRRMNSTFKNYFSYWMVAENTLDEKIIKILDNRTKNNSLVLTGKEISEKELLMELFKNR